MNKFLIKLKNLTILKSNGIRPSIYKNIFINIRKNIYFIKILENIILKKK